MPDVLDFALETAHRAGRLLVEFATREFDVGHKSTPGDLVTEADLAAERLIVDAIRGAFPDHAILSEEGLGDRQDAVAEVSYLWLVDPLDGTVNYAHHYPIWAVSLALAERGEVRTGVIYDPLRDEMFWAERGRGAWLHDRRLHVSGAARLEDALMATGFPYVRDRPAANNLPEFNALMHRTQALRRAGAAVLDLAHVAAGRLDGYWEKNLKPWDWAAGSLLVEEAGGRVTTLDGRRWSITENDLVASNVLFHDELIAALRQARLP